MTYVPNLAYGPWLRYQDLVSNAIVSRFVVVYIAPRRKIRTTLEEGLQREIRAAACAYSKPSLMSLNIS